jgi:electron transfer flavoprotein alpha subunit
MARRAIRTIALVKQVPRGELSGLLGPDGRLRRDHGLREMNPFCRRAVAHARRVAQETGGTSTAITMGPPEALEVLREAVAWGIDSAVHVSDPQLAGSDCLVTARALARAIALNGHFDVVFVGRSSIDADTSAVGPMVAELLDLPFIGPALALEIVDGTATATLQLDGAVEKVQVDLPAVVTVAERSCAPAKVPVEEWPDVLPLRTLTCSELGVGPWGEAGSPTRVCGVRSMRRNRTPRVFPASAVDEAVETLAALGALSPAGDHSAPTPAVSTLPPTAAAGGAVSQTAAPPHGATVLVAVGPASDDSALRLIASASRLGGHVVAVGDRNRHEWFARCGADELLTPTSEQPQGIAAALARRDELPWAVLAPASSWGRELLARLAVRWGSGLLSDLTELEPGAGQRLRGGKPCGDGQVADLVCVGPVQLATVRTGCLPPPPLRQSVPILIQTLEAPADPSVRLLERIQDDDAEALDRADVVIGVGRGVEPRSYRLLEPLRSLLGGELGATRPVTDSGFLPHSRQIGLTAHSVAPRLYVAIGISGRDNHMIGVGGASAVLAVNSDPAAEVFERCDVGIVGDWRLVVPQLTNALAARSSLVA